MLKHQNATRREEAAEQVRVEKEKQRKEEAALDRKDQKLASYPYTDIIREEDLITGPGGGVRYTYAELVREGERSPVHDTIVRDIDRSEFPAGKEATVL